MSLLAAVTLFCVSAVAILFAGTRLVLIADRLAARTGFGQALLGGVLLGACTSLSGTVTSFTAAWTGHPGLAVSNAVGGIAVQTLFLAIADLTYRKANLEHAAASEENLLQAGLLILLLSLPMAAAIAPEVTLFRVHPITPLILIVYILGLRRSVALRLQPMWRPRQTEDTKGDRPKAQTQEDTSTRVMLLSFILFASLLAVAGWATAKSGLSIVESTGFSESFVGAALTATATSLPELVTTLAAVRRGALALAVGGIVGGNTFDVLFLVVGDLAYRDGSLYHAVGAAELLLFPWSIIMTAILLIGLIARQRKGLARIGFEGVALIATYVLGLVLQIVMH